MSLRLEPLPPIPKGHRHACGAADRLALGRALGGASAKTRTLGPAGTPSLVTSDGALCRDDVTNTVCRGPVGTIARF
jgi:hypothetical protein